MIYKLKKEHRNIILSFLVFVILFILSLDFWGWGEPKSAGSLVFGLPIWICYIVCLTLLTSVFFYILSFNIWGEEK